MTTYLCFEPCVESGGYAMVKNGLITMFRAHVETIMAKNPKGGWLLQNYIQNIHGDVHCYLPYLFKELDKYQFDPKEPILKENDKIEYYDKYYVIINDETRFSSWGCK